MRTSHLLLAAATVTFVGVAAWTLHHHEAPRAASQRMADPLVPVAEADIPAGLDATVQQLSDLLEAGDAEQALRLCWAPSNLDQMSRSGLFTKCAELIKEDQKLRPTLRQILAAGPTKTYKTREGFYFAEFDQNRAELTSMRFEYVNNHWYVW